MAVTKLSNSTFTGLNKYDSFLAGNAMYIPSSYESIQTVTVGSGGASTITFSSIPSTYSHLQIRGIGRYGQSSAGDTQIRFNSDSGTNYFLKHYINGNGSTASASGGGASATNGSVGYTAGSATTANVFGAYMTDILDYSNTNKYKTMRTLNGFDANGSGQIFLWSSLWMSTSAINSITLYPDGGTFAQYSSFALYGIK